MRLDAPGALLMALLSLSAFGAPEAELWDRWTTHGMTKVAVDHGAWDAFLQRHVVAGKDGLHRIDYGAVPAADRKTLDDYLGRLQATRIADLAREEQRAFWINLYNAATVQVVLRHYPVDSIREINISPGLFARGPWGKKFLKVEGVVLSLNDIEHRILRPIWKDPRVHYAVNCASLGCPNLAQRAYSASAMEAMLDEGARAFVNHPRGARVEDGELVVSSIYHWFEADFGGTEAGILDHLRRYADGPLRRTLQDRDRMDNHAYDWTLNDLE